MARIMVRAEESLLGAGYPRAWAAHVTVTTRARRHERTVTHVPGDPARPFGEEELMRKFARVVAPLLDHEQAGAMFAEALGSIERPGAMLDAIDRVASRGGDQRP
jgi:2-methylcitrate dehydratase PrpD